MNSLRCEVEIVGAATTPFGKHLDTSLAALGQRAALDALTDAGLQASDVDCVVFGNAAEGVLTGQEMIRGQVVLDGSELAGPAVVNVENACASGSSALHLATLLVASGQYDCVLALGAEKLFHADKSRSFDAIRAGVNQAVDLSGATADGSVMMACYAAEARAYAEAHGPVEEALAAVSAKNRAFAETNPNAQYRMPVTAAEVLASRSVAAPLRMLMCAPMTDGAAAVVVRRAAARDERSGRAVRIAETRVAGYRRGDPVVARVAAAVRRRAGITAADVDVWQLHDACAFAEIAQYEQVGIARPGEGVRAVLDGRTGPDGDAPVNTDGGLLSRGHPLGATGLAQVVELVRQLRQEGGANLVPDAGLAMAISGGGWMGDDYAACVATLLSRT
jgi:acetyl-CoA acetyltransferase